MLRKVVVGIPYSPPPLEIGWQFSRDTWCNCAPALSLESVDIGRGRERCDNTTGYVGGTTTVPQVSSTPTERKKSKT